MKAVVMGGGKGTRLAPMTNPLNKHTLAVGDRPMIHHVLHTLARGGVTDVLILLNWKHPGILIEQVGAGNLFGLDIVFKYLAEADEYDPGRDGPGGQLYAAERWVNGEPFVLMLGDSFYHPTLEMRFDTVAAPHMWVMPLGDFDEHSKYSQVLVDHTGLVRDFREHPQERFSDLIQTGVWLLPSYVFDFSRRLQTETEGELRVSKIIKELIFSERMEATILPSESFIDLGTPEALLQGAYIALSHRQ